MSTTTNTKMLAAAAAVAISSAGLIIYPQLARAQPCEKYGFYGETVIIEDGTGWTVSFTAGAAIIYGEKVLATNSKTGESPRIGTTGGGFTTPTDIELTIQYPQGTQIYKGVVGSDGIARGVTAAPPFDGINWQTRSPLRCAVRTGSSPQQQAPPPEQAPPPAQAPTNAISVNFSDVPGGLKVNVNNSSNVAGTCTYDATAPNSPIPPSHKDFTVGANGGTSFQISGIPTGTEYNTVTVCRGNFQGKDVEIGRVELKKSF